MGAFLICREINRYINGTYKRLRRNFVIWSGHINEFPNARDPDFGQPETCIDFSALYIAYWQHDNRGMTKILDKDIFQ